MPFVNTGQKINYFKDRVVDGGPHDGELLDENNNLSVDSGLPPDQVSIEPSDPEYMVYDEVNCPRVPVTINYSLIRDNDPFVDGSIGFGKNGTVFSELITFIGTGTSSLNYKKADTANINLFHYHLGYRWTEDSSLTVNIREGGITGNIIFTYTGGLINDSDVVGYELYLTKDTYTVEVYTTSNATGYSVLGYDLTNNTSATDGQIKFGAIDDATGVYWLGQSPSEITIPNNGVARQGSYNMPIVGATQSIPIKNDSSIDISVTLSTVFGGGTTTLTQLIPAGTPYTFPPIEKTGFSLTIN